jgi:hypothetical protein
VFPDFALRDLEGKEVRLSDYRGRMPIVLEFGSSSCGITTGHACVMDYLADKYQGRAQFLFVYSREEHPGDGQFRSSSFGVFKAQPQARNHEERVEHARAFQHDFNCRRPVLVGEAGADGNPTWLGDSLHVVYVVDAQGYVSWVSGGPTYEQLDSVLRQETAQPGAAPGRFLNP